MNKFAYNSVSCFEQRPSQNIRYLIRRQLPKLIQNAIADSAQFHSNSEKRAKHLQQFKYIVLLAQENIKEHLQFIIMKLIEIRQKEIDNVEDIIQQIMKIVGFHVKSSFYLPLMMNLLSEDKIKNSINNVVILLKIISYMLSTAEDLQDHVLDLLSLITNYEKLLIESDQGLITVQKISLTLIERLPHYNYDKFIPTVFSVLLNVQATRSITQKQRDQSHKGMQTLAKKAGYGTVAELHSQEVGPVLQNIISTKEYRNWTKVSKNRFKFDSIVRNCHSQVSKFLPSILQILQFCIAPDSDIEMRMDTLVLIEYLIKTQQLRESLKQYSIRIVKQILNVAIKWKVGQPQIMIRQAGIINMIRLIENQIISDSELLQCFDEILPQVKGCMHDDWGPTLRLRSCEFMEKFLKTTRDLIDSEQLKQVYVILLERLDDSKDDVRKKVTIAINMFFLCRYLPSAASISSILQYMLGAIFVHYDDNNEQIRDAINISLRYGAKVDPEQVLKLGKINLQKMKHKGQCSQLLQYCEQIIQERKL